MAIAKDLQSTEEESIVGCLKESQVCSSFGCKQGVSLFPTASLEQCQTCLDGWTCSLTQCANFGCSYAKIVSVSNSYPNSRGRDKGNVKKGKSSLEVCLFTVCVHCVYGHVCVYGYLYICT